MTGSIQRREEYEANRKREADEAERKRVADAEAQRKRDQDAATEHALILGTMTLGNIDP